jgi:CubicO group peptidase (beta-lactamase class C family)
LYFVFKIQYCLEWALSINIFNRKYAIFQGGLFQGCSLFTYNIWSIVLNEPRGLPMRNAGGHVFFLEAAADPCEAELSVKRVKALEEWIRGKARNRLYGCIILRKGRIGAEFYGGGFTAESLFEIGSIRKSFNSALIGNGIKEGKISLNHIAVDVWPELLDISGDPADKDITLHQLVSGISGWLTPDPPGKNFTYNNAAFTVAEKVVARLFGFAKDEIAPDVEKRFKGILNARSWRLYHFPRKFDRLDIDNPGPKLAIDSTLRDLIKWGFLWLNKGVWDGQELIPAEYVALATGPVTPEIPNARYGYNWFVNVDRMLWPQAPADSYGHAGFGTFKPSEKDSRAFLWVCPSLDMAAAIVSDIEVGFANDFLEVPMTMTADWIARVAATAGC